MTAILADYPLKAVEDSRTALAGALADLFKMMVFTVPRTKVEPFKLRAVYTRWAQFRDRASGSSGDLPAAAVLPDRPSYTGAGLTPDIIEGTWSGGDPTEVGSDGQPLYPLGDGTGDGFVLVEVAQLRVPFVVLTRAKSEAQSKAMAKVIEEAFIEDGTSLPDVSSLNEDIDVPDASVQPVRYGRVVRVPRYYNREARFTLGAQQLLDSESSVAENRWMAQFELLGEMQVCALRRLRAMSPRVELTVDDEVESR